MPAGVRGEPGVKEIRHYRNADGKLLVDITRSLRASERSKAAPLANLRGGPCVVPAGITLTCGFLSLRAFLILEKPGSTYRLQLTLLSMPRRLR